MEDTPQLTTRHPGGAVLILPAFLALAVFFAYMGSLRGPFVFDDRPAIAANQAIHTLDPGTALFPSEESGLTGRPLLQYSFAVNRVLFGPSTLSFHLANILIHILSAWLLFGLVWETTRSQSPETTPYPLGPWLAFWTALLWALHPANTSAVTHLAQRGQSLAGMWFLALFYCLARARGSGRQRSWNGLAVFCFFVGAGTHESMVAALPLVFLYQWVFFEQKPLEILGNNKGLYGSLALGSAAMVIFALCMATIPVDGQSHHYTWDEYLFLQPRVALEYLGVFFYPQSLSLDYGWPVFSASDAWTSILVILALASGSGLLMLRKKPAGFLGAWFLLTLAPIPGPDRFQTLMADHRMYLPSMALCALGAGAALTIVGKTLEPRPQKILAAVFFALALGLAGYWGAATWSRNADYKTTISIWADNVYKQPKNHRAWSSLGYTLMDNRRWTEALEVFEKAYTLEKYSATIHNGLALALAHRGRVKRAEKHFLAAIAIQPGYLAPRNSLGLLLFTNNQPREARRQLEKVLSLDPGHAGARNNLGYLLLHQNKPREAIEHLALAASLDPGHTGVWTNLGLAWERLGELERAQSAYARALVLVPAWITPRVGLARVLLAAGDKEQAKFHMDIAASQKPDNPELLELIKAFEEP